MKQFAFILIITFLSLDCALAQKIRNASGMAQFRLEEDISKDELKDKLRHHAIINAIEREYGTYVTQESFVDVDDGNTRFRIFGKTVVQGEWLKTTSEDFKEEMIPNSPEFERAINIELLNGFFPKNSSDRVNAF